MSIDWSEFDMSIPKVKHGLWIDDLRDVPLEYETRENWIWHVARNGIEALHRLATQHYDEVSFDHDLATFVGNKEINGYDILLWLVEQKQNGMDVPEKVRVHSANPVGVEKMKDLIDKFWN